jgi:hypothetical protein
MLARMLLDATPISEIARHLDGLSPAARREALAATTRAEQRSLYEKAKASAPITMADLIPEGVEAGAQVRHFGRNTLPLPAAWRTFEKRFARPEDGSVRGFGYNESPTRSLIGPGFFVAIRCDGNDAWMERGAVVIDYFQVPDGPVPTNWPRVVPNSKGLQMFVYQGTRDFMRKVSEGVSIGSAYKGEKKLDHYFTLVREGLPGDPGRWRRAPTARASGAEPAPPGSSGVLHGASPFAAVGAGAGGPGGGRLLQGTGPREPPRPGAVLLGGGDDPARASSLRGGPGERVGAGPPAPAADPGDALAGAGPLARGPPPGAASAGEGRGDPGPRAALRPPGDQPR